MLRLMHRFSVALAALAAVVFGIQASLAQGEKALTFSGKIITMIVGFPPGGGTDAVARLVGNTLSKYLPGQPTFIVQNVPGAEGVTAMNYMVQQVKTDGLTAIMGASTQADPMYFRRPNAQYDPAKFLYIGGIGRGGTVVVIDANVEWRLYDKAAQPVIMGSISGTPRNGMQISLWGIEYLGWNAKWVVGYPGTNDVMLALSRGEVDMTATGNIFEISDLVHRGKLKIIAQSGDLQNGKIVARPDFGNAPLFPDLMKGKITDPVAEEAFEYWRSTIAVDKFLALPPGTPTEIVAAYREAYRKLLDDQDFVAQGKKISEDFTPMRSADVDLVVKTLTNTSTKALDFMKIMMRKQGLTVN